MLFERTICIPDILQIHDIKCTKENVNLCRNSRNQYNLNQILKLFNNWITDVAQPIQNNLVGIHYEISDWVVIRYDDDMLERLQKFCQRILWYQ